MFDNSSFIFSTFIEEFKWQGSVGVNMYQKIISFKCDGYFSNVTITTYQEDTVDAVLEQFYFIKNI